MRENALECLRMKLAEEPESSRLCSLVVDEMTIKEEVRYNEERDDVEGLGRSRGPRKK